MNTVNEQTGPGTTRRHLFSLSSVFRSHSGKRASIIESIQEEPTCQERIHYPVFNPLDPRHNPEIRGSNFSWRRDEQRSSSSESHSPMAWVQSISRLSLHKARSGLLALRSGLIHRSSEEDSPERSFVSPVALKRERQRHGVSYRAYTSDTQEDLTFGAELARMNLTPSAPRSNVEAGPLIRVSSVNSIPDSLETLPASDPVRDLFRLENRAVSNSGVNSPYTPVNGHDLDFQFAGTGGLGPNMDSEDHFTHTTPLIEDHLIRQTWGIAISTDEEIAMSTHELADPQSVLGEQQAINPQQQNISYASSDTQISDDQQSPVPISRQCSAEVRFAFPGIYHEALDQWARQHRSPTPSQHIPNLGRRSLNLGEHTPNLSEHSPNLSEHSPNLSEHSPNLSAHSPNTSQHSSSPGQHNANLSQNSLNLDQHTPMLYEQEEPPHASPGPLECTVLQDDTCSNLPPYHEYDEALTPLVLPQTPITHSEEAQPFSYPNLLLGCTSNRNFGERWSSISERTTTQWSSVEDYSSRYATDDTTSRDITSTEMTSMESLTNDTWSPIHSELLFTSPVEDGNGYFLFDSKTNSQYPDRGNQPVKSVQHTTSSCGNIRGCQEIPDVISPGVLSLRLIPDGIPNAGLNFVEEDTDDEFYPGTVQPSQVW
ncbi:uncharacterized protein N7479_003601 [Penicillium vulpinum]|uniref:Uncharacterized protein n=1 Tax=Penicillium vulpinum TaxID=29845 RepID=A0A1V6RW41_9EURO|nr:uncharacterized protein N7479_003601 [Penicillium vulpinum]KAJ5963725.1 hypothetical protein N7479_003601 [Penicillium vulpinum]OQE05972.1 hypothetical protein PENVUL_c020G10249 [Penicillium vulpinum]